ncbi:hypothetical protein [Hymenobacter fodinae]|uniref:Uncharacterized protein n=1 Tax=Hymenobacter fodinae TaxID=2510796 RepID=A0A4Z0P5T5_9BACT|nr:hypothetical protein [Hymenobacter fodinae]TGE06018.1 hypothetical protein EU556_14210 [Hymenobacter fodinae]
MKKALLFTASLLLALGALAQEPTAPNGKHPAGETAKARKHKIKDQGEADKATPDTHGQQVQALAHSTPLTGADKGAAISTFASNGHSAAHGERQIGSARGNRNHGRSRGADCVHQGGGHQQVSSHRNGH